MMLRSIILALLLAVGSSAYSQGLSNILKRIGGAGQDVTTAIGNLVEGVFSTSNITVQDIAGNYVSDGPAVSFKSENLLKKAGGVAGAAAVEAKLKPYYEQYGLTGMKFSVGNDSTFTMNVKGMSLSGTIERDDKSGTFKLNIMAMGIRLAQFTTYIQKTGKNIDLMFDATKLKKFVTMVSSISGSTATKTIGKVLDGYDGMTVGFHMSRVSDATEEK